MDLCREYAEKIHHTDSQTGNCGHFYLDKEGQIFQFVEVTHIAHHVRGLNERTLGIELINQGRYPHWFQSDHQSVTDPYPDSQIQSLVILLRSLQQKIETLSYLAGHEDLDRGFVQADDNPALQIRRKIDPGPLFPWDKVMQAVRPLQRVTEL